MTTKVLMDVQKVPTVPGYTVDTAVSIRTVGDQTFIILDQCSFPEGQCLEYNGKFFNVVDTRGAIVDGDFSVVMPLEILANLLKEHGLV